MKSAAITLMLGVLVAIPFILRRREAALIARQIKTPRQPRELNENLRYDVDELLTE